LYQFLGIATVVLPDFSLTIAATRMYNIARSCPRGSLLGRLLV
jgi:hypothetical protein